MSSFEISQETILLDFHKTLRRFKAYGKDAANWFDGSIFRKAIELDSHIFLLEMKSTSSGIALSLFPETNDEFIKAKAGEVAKHILGLKFDLESFYQSVSDDPLLSKICAENRGFRPTLAVDPFEALVTSISAQQINLQFAFTVRSRFVEKFGERIDYQNQTYFAFPNPERIAAIAPAQLRELQFTEKKSEYIVGIAQAIAAGDLQMDELTSNSASEIQETLCAFRGIGRWTVDWYLSRCLGRPDAFPAGDLGVRKAVQKIYFDAQNKTEAEIREFASQWKQHANLACHYLLTALYA